MKINRKKIDEEINKSKYLLCKGMKLFLCYLFGEVCWVAQNCMRLHVRRTNRIGPQTTTKCILFSMCVFIWVCHCNRFRVILFKRTIPAVCSYILTVKWSLDTRVWPFSLEKKYAKICWNQRRFESLWHCFHPFILIFLLRWKIRRTPHTHERE